MKNIYKKLFVLFVLILTALLIFSVVQIYAKYLATASGSTNVEIAKWNIKVNTLSIKTNTDISANIEPIFPGTSYISNGIIAPSAEGYFDLNLDFSESDVAFQYKIETHVSETSPVQDLVATGYKIDDNEQVLFETYNTDIIETIPLHSDTTSKTIRVYLKWIDDESTQTMSNSDDTSSTSSESPITFNVKISFTQIIDDSSTNTTNTTNTTDSSPDEEEST